MKREKGGGKEKWGNEEEMRIKTKEPGFPSYPPAFARPL